MRSSHSSAEALGSMSEGIGRIVAAPGTAAIEAMTGGSGISTIKSETRQGVQDVLYGPFRIAGRSALGALKGAGRLLLAGALNLGIWPVWQKERQEVATKTSNKLEKLAGGLT